MQYELKQLLGYQESHKSLFYHMGWIVIATVSLSFPFPVSSALQEQVVD